MKIDRKRLIEVSLPLEAISTQSAREKSIRHGHISTLHIWWARRPLAAMRAAIFASLVPAPETDDEREELEKLIATIVDWDQVKDGNSPKVLEARQKVLDAFDGCPPRVLDPFMGSGATGLEALRLGCETHALELNPVAHLIELCTLVYPQKYGQPDVRTVEQGALEVEQEVNPLAEDVRQWGQWVLERAREEIGHLYEDPVNGQTVVGYLWARTVKCPNPACGAEMPLVRQWWLAKKKNRKIALKPKVDRVAKRVTFEVVRGSALKSFDPYQGTGRRGHFVCLVCNQETDAAYISTEGQARRMGEMPLAVIYDQSGVRGYRPFIDQDKGLFQEALAMLAEMAEEAPNELLASTGTLSFNVQRYGLARWSDLFNPRQLLTLLTLSRKVRASYEAMMTEGMDSKRARAVVTYLGIALDRIADSNSSLARWVSQRESSASTLTRQALPMVWDYIEANPLSHSSGNWMGALDRIVLVIKHTAQSSARSAIVHQGTATRLPYPDGHFDVIVADPPYYDAVHYAELSDFFYVWLKRSLGFLYPDVFSTHLSPKSEEIIQESTDSDSEAAASTSYEQELMKAFSEAGRVLDAHGVLIVLFPYETHAPLAMLLNVLLNAGLDVTASWPLRTRVVSSHVRLRTHDTIRLPFPTPLFVCRRRTAESQRCDYLRVRAQVRARVREVLSSHTGENTATEDLLISVIGPALEVFGRNRPAVKADGEHATVSEVLHEVQEEVIDFVLIRELVNDEVARS